MGARRRFLIDPAGAVQELSPAGLRASPALRRQLGETGAATGAGEVDLARLVERQGFACLSLGARALVHVNVRRSTPHTTAALLIMLAEQTAQRFAVSYYDAAWSHHLFHGKAHAINHIAMTLDEAQFAPGGQLRKRALPLSAIHRWPALASVPRFSE